MNEKDLAREIRSKEQISGFFLWRADMRSRFEVPSTKDRGWRVKSSFANRLQYVYIKYFVARR